MSSRNKGRHRAPFSNLEKEEIAKNYLVYGTFRNVEEKTGVSKTAAHRIVRDFIDNGGFDESEKLKKLIEKNKAEASRRGGKKSKPRRKKVK